MARIIVVDIALFTNRAIRRIDVSGRIKSLLCSYDKNIKGIFNV